MGLQWSLTYLIIFLQVLTGVILLRANLTPRLAVRLLGALFLFNAGVSAIMGLPRETSIWLASDGGWVTRAFRALDVSTVYLLLAFLAARSRYTWARPAAYLLVGIGGVLAILEFPFHRTMVDHEHIYRAIPLYFALGAGAYLLAGGRGWEPWLGLGLTARALYWGSAGVIEVARSGFGDVPHLLVDRIGLVLLAGVAVAAAVRLLRREDRLRTIVVVPVLVIGVAATLFETGVALALPPGEPFRYGSVVLVNLITLGLVRPILTVIGISPESLFPVVARVLLASGAAAVSTMVIPPFQLVAGVGGADDITAYGFGLCVGLLAIAVLDAVPPLHLRGPGAPSDDAGDPPDASPPPVMPAEPLVQAVAPIETGRPQWQVILGALRGSALPPGAPSTGEARLTQKGLGERVGLRVSRVSTLAADLNANAVARLDAHVPGWREDHPAHLSVELVRQYRGAVPGMPGVWVYYRLTPLGEALAAHAWREFPENSSAS